MCSYLSENRALVKPFIQNKTDSDITLIFQNYMDGFITSRKVLYRGRIARRIVKESLKSVLSQR